MKPNETISPAEQSHSPKVPATLLPLFAQFIFQNSRYGAPSVLSFTQL